MALNVVASTSSALAAGLLRFELAGARATQAAAGSIDPELAAGEPSGDGSFALPLYDAHGRTTTPPASDDLVSAVGELLRAKQGVEVDAALLKRVHELQGTLLDVLA
jgi:hypothetical protein